MKKLFIAALLCAAATPALADHLAGAPPIGVPIGPYETRGDCEMAAADKRAELQHYNRGTAHECLAVTDGTGETEWFLIWQNR